MSRRPFHPQSLDANEALTIDQLRDLQLERLKWSVAHAYENVPFYRRKFDEARMHPSDIRSLADLAKLPFTTKQDLRDHFPYGMFAVPREQVVRIHASSGTTGQATVVGYTKRDLDNWSDVVARSIRAAGGAPGDIVMVSYGYGLFTGGLGAHYGAERLGCTVIPTSGGQTARQVQLIRDLKPDIIMVTPSYLLTIAEEYERQGGDPRNSSLKIAICGAEPWTAELRKAIEERWDIDALDIYGLSEVIGPGVASECVETRDGAVIWEDHFFPEIIDPVSCEVLPDGDPGELVFTSLTKQALPVIRYRTRDLTRLLPPTARPMRRMDRIAGRSDDMLIVRGVNVFPTQIEQILLGHAQLAPHFQFVLSRNGWLDNLEVIAEMRASCDPSHGNRIAGEIRHELKTVLGITTEVRIVPANTLLRCEGGKAVRVMDKRAD